MKGMVRGFWAGIFFLSSVGAFAGGFEKPVMFGARALAMGGIGVGFDPTISAVYYNPAHFMRVEKCAFGSDSLPTFTSVNSDLGRMVRPTDGSSLGARQNEQSELLFLPIGSLGGVMRLGERFLIGLGFYSPAGLATTYRNVGTNDGAPVGTDVSAINKVKLKVDFKVFELAPFLVFEVVPKKLAIALQYRAIYGVYNSEFRDTQGTATPTDDDVFFDFEDVDGFEFLGGRLGILWEMNKNVQIGLQVRSEIEADGFDGEATVRFGGVSLKNAKVTINDARLPWEFSAGIAFIADQRAFVVALDLGFRLYGENDTIDVVIAGLPDAAKDTFDFILNWHDTGFIRIGGELKVYDHFYMRMGGGFVTHVTRTSFDTPFLTIPENGLFWGFGFGMRGQNIVSDIGLGFEFANARGRFPSPFGDGTSFVHHSGFAFSFGLSMTYYTGGAPS